MSHSNYSQKKIRRQGRQDSHARKLRFENLEARELLSASTLYLASTYVPSALDEMVTPEKPKCASIPIKLANKSATGAYDDAQFVANAALVTTALDVVDPNDGQTSLREALANPSVVEIAFATSLKGTTITLKSELVVSSPKLVIDATALWNDELNSPGITIDAKSLGRALTASQRNITLRGLRFVNGKTSDEGGAIYAPYSTLTIEDCDFEKNEARNGGALYGYQSNLTLREVSFTANFATYNGGAVYVAESPMTLLTSKFVRNTSTNQGGAIFLTGDNSSASVTNSLIADNSSEWGGFAVSWGGSLTLTNSTIANNKATSGGGAVYINAAPVNAYNSIFALNSATWSNDVQRTNAKFNAYNCLVSGYVNDNLDENIIVRDGESIFLDSDVGDYRLSPHSRAVDAGLVSYAVSPNGDALQVDLRGAARVVGSAVDLGAYEYNPSIDPYVAPKIADTYVDYLVSTPYYDADKYMDDTDSLQCWAGSVSSMLWSTRWGRLDGLTDEEDLFHQKFGANFPNRGNNENCAVGWFLNNDYLTDQARESGGYYASLFEQYNEPTTLYRAATDAYGVAKMLEMATRLRSGVAVGFAIDAFNQTSGASTGGGHALTAYGYAYNPALDPSDPNYYTRIYYVDSNDGGRMTGQRDRKLQSLEIQWQDNLKIGSETKGGYVVTNYGMGDPETDAVVVYGFTYLAQRPAKYAPDREKSANLYLAETLDDLPVTFTSTERGTLNSTTFLEGEEVAVNFKIQSTTNLPASTTVTCQILVDDKPTATIDVNPVAKGQSQTYAASLGKLDAGVHIITVVVDSTENVDESNEDDNAFAVAITVSADEYVVVNTAQDVVDPNDGLTSLREALALAGAFGNSSRVAFDESLRGATISLDAGKIDVERCIVVDASALWNDDDARPGVAINANGKSAIFSIKNNVEVKFVALELTNGYASRGGALDLNNVSVTLDRCWITDNKASDGGAINVSASDLTILNSVVKNNSATGQGGAIYLWSSERSVYIANSLFVNNSAEWGGVAMNWGVDMTFANATIVKNYASQGGGVMYAKGANLSFYNSILALNSASWSDDIQSDETTIAGYHSIATRNLWTQGDSNSTEANKELFTNADANDFTLASNSVAVDFGDNEYAIDDVGKSLSYDLNGFARRSSEGNNTVVDAGAYEFQFEAQLTSPTITTSSTATAILVEWEQVANASGYEVLCDATSVVLDAEVKRYEFEDLAPSTNYSIKVSALGRGALRNSEFAIATVSTKEIQLLDAPNITHGESTDVSVSIAWTPIANAVGYVVAYAKSDASDFTILDVGGEESVTIEPLSSGTTYKFKVRAIGDDKETKSSGYGELATFTTSVVSQRLDSPTITLIPTSNAISATWTSVEHASGYEIVCNNIVKRVTAQTRTCQFASLKPSTSYLVSVKALGDDVYYTDSVPSEVTVETEPLQPLSAPNVTVTPFATSIEATWNAVEEATNYLVEYKESNSANYKTIIVNSGTSCVIPNLEPGTSYKLRVVANDLEHNRQTSSEEAEVTTLAVKLETPEVVTSKTIDSITLKWTSVDHATGYKITSVDKKITVGSQATNYSFQGLKPSTIYDLTVVALGDGTHYADSDRVLVTVETDPLTPLAPPIVTATPSDVSIALNWNAVDDATHYAIECAEANASDYATIATIAATNYTIDNLTPGASYQLRITACDEANARRSEPTQLTISTLAQTLATPELTQSQTSDSITVSWEHVSHAVAYELACGDLKQVVDAQTSTFDFSSLTPATAYSVSVKALGNGTNYLDSPTSTINVTTLNEIVAQEGQAVVLSADGDATETVYWNLGDGGWREASAQFVVDPSVRAFTPGKTTLQCRRTNESMPFYAIDLNVVETSPSIFVEQIAIANEQAAIYRIETNFAGRSTPRDWRVDWGDGTSTLYLNQYAFVAGRVYANTASATARNITITLLDDDGDELYSTTLLDDQTPQETSNAVREDDLVTNGDARNDVSTLTNQPSCIAKAFELDWALAELADELFMIEQFAVCEEKENVWTRYFDREGENDDSSLDLSIDVDLNLC